MKKFLIPAAIASSLLLGAGQAQALVGPVALDSFNSGTTNIDITGPVPKPSETEMATGNMVGGTRTSTLDLVAGTTEQKSSTLAVGGSDFDALAVSNDTGFNSAANVVYDGVTASSPLDVQGSFFYFDITDFDKAFNGAVTIDLTVNGTTVSKAISVAVAPSDLQDVTIEYPFSAFGLSQKASISDLSFDIIGSVASYDIEIDNFGYFAVPAPAIVPGTILAGVLLTKFKSLANKKQKNA